MCILIMQNSAHFGKNGFSNLVREGKNFRCFLPHLLHTAGEKRKKKMNMFGKDTSLFSIFFIIFDYNIQIF